MDTRLEKIYNSEDLPGEFFLRPLKNYHLFFENIIEESSGYEKTAWLIAKLVTALFCYPTFGLLAGIGMINKLTGIDDPEKHNQAEKAGIEVIRVGVNNAAGYSRDSSHYVSGAQMSLVKEFKITKQNVNDVCASINQEIDSLSSQLREIYVSASGLIDNDIGEITVQLKARKYSIF